MEEKEVETSVTILSEKTLEPSKCTLLLHWMWSGLQHLFPILYWLPRYNRREWLVADISAGLTVAVMHIPQGMAYGLLASVAPVSGLYTAIFPVMVYVVMGTSRHNSFGTFAVISLLVSRSVESQSQMLANQTNHEDSNTNDAPQLKAMETATALTLLVGILQVSFGVLQVDRLVCSLLSRPLVNGFSTGAAVHVFTSQIKFVLGLDKLAPVIRGPFRILRFYSALLPLMWQTNVPCLLMAVVASLVLIVYNAWLDKRVTTALRGVQVPIQLVVIVLSILVVSILELHLPPHNLKVVGNVPTGLPSLKLPSLEPSLLSDALVTSVVAYVISFSLGSMLAEKHRYQIDARQEWFAQGCSNLLGSCFSSLPVSASLSRTLVQDAAGCRSLMTSVVSVVLLLLVLLFAGPSLHNLPLAVLSSIILVSLSSMFVNLAKWPEMWSKERDNAVIWLVAFLATAIVDVDYGLVIGCLANVLAMILRRRASRVAHRENLENDCDLSRRLGEEEDEEQMQTTNI